MVAFSKLTADCYDCYVTPTVPSLKIKHLDPDSLVTNVIYGRCFFCVDDKNSAKTFLTARDSMYRTTCSSCKGAWKLKAAEIFTTSFEAHAGWLMAHMDANVDEGPKESVSGKKTMTINKPKIKPQTSIQAKIAILQKGKGIKAGDEGVKLKKGDSERPEKKVKVSI